MSPTRLRVLVLIMITFTVGFTAGNFTKKFSLNKHNKARETLEQQLAFLELPIPSQVLNMSIASSDSKSLDIPPHIATNSLIYYEVSNVGEKTATPKIVINDKDWSTIDALVNQMIDVEMSDEEKAISIWQFVVQNRIHDKDSLADSAATTYEEKLREYEPVKYLNIWGYSECGSTAATLARLSRVAGFRARVVHLVDQHSVAEVFYDGGWHMFDADGEVFFRKSDNNIASVREIINNPALLSGMQSPIYSKELMREYYSKSIEITTQEFNSREIAKYTHKMLYSLRPNEKIRFYLDYKGKYFDNTQVLEPSERRYSAPLNFTNGFLSTRAASEELHSQGLRIELPYPIVGAYVTAINLCKDKTHLYSSFDGKEWEPVTGECFNDVIYLNAFIPTRSSSPIYQFFTKTDRRTKRAPTIVTQFQLSPFSFPRLHVGYNRINIDGESVENINVTFGFQ